MQPIRSRKHRLDATEYVGRNVAFTLCLERRERAFTSPEIVRENVRMLAAAAERYDCTVPLYCFMPEHLHLIVNGRVLGGSPLDVVKSYKGRSGRWFRQSSLSARWQPSFHDHIVRGPQDWREQVIYILKNPRLAGLAPSWREYEFVGSLSSSIEDLLTEANSLEDNRVS